jgi:uncharacterized protein YecE (DUF72 family)
MENRTGKVPHLAAGEVRIGTSGWSYDDWRGVLYPPGTGPRRLEVYAESFDTVELNASFYHWPRGIAFRSWAQRLPEGFLMTVKAPRGLTHARKLRTPEAWTDRIAAAPAGLGSHCGPLLLQLPPGLERDDARLAAALVAMPEGCRVAVELRHPSWVHDDVFALLERHDASYCVMSGAELPCELRATSDLVYVRFHGPDPQRLYAGSYPDEDLAWWANRIGEWRRAGHSVMCYFNNDGQGNAVRNALKLREFALQTQP